ncbi:hypothetical protein Tco_0576035 [Tanacetum coccineum]
MVPATTPPPGVQRRDILVIRANITDGDFRRRRTLNKRLDELHGCQISVTVQQYHQPPGPQENPSGSIHRSRNAKILGGRRNGDNPQQYHNTSGMQNGSGSIKRTPTGISSRKGNKSSNPSRTSRTNHHDRWKLIRERKDGALQSAERQLGHICLETSRHDWRPKIHSRTPFEQPRRMSTRKAEKKGAGTGPRQSDPEGSRQVGGSRNHKGSTLS